MRNPITLSLALAVLACGGPYPTEAAAARIAQVGAVPDCASLDWATQSEADGVFTISARYLAADTCRSEWYLNLESSGFESQLPHGEWVKSFEPLILVTSGDDGVVVVIFENGRALEGVEIWRGDADL